MMGTSGGDLDQPSARYPHAYSHTSAHANACAYTDPDILSE